MLILDVMDMKGRAGTFCAMLSRQQYDPAVCSVEARTLNRTPGSGSNHCAPDVAIAECVWCESVCFIATVNSPFNSLAHAEKTRPIARLGENWVRRIAV